MSTSALALVPPAEALVTSDPANTLRSILGDADMDMLRDCFIFLDHDGDGLVSPQTIGAVVLSAIGPERYSGYEPYLLHIFEAADKDKDGFLSLIEFIECYAEGPGIVPQEVVAECVSGVRIRMSDEEVNVLQKVFFRLDTDEDGLLGMGELLQGLSTVFGRGVPQEVINNAATLIIEATDRDSDGKLNVSDFILSFQYDQKVIPLELIEHKPASILQNLTQQELFAIRQVMVPFLVEEDQRVAFLNQYFQLLEQNPQRPPQQPQGGLPMRPSSALQAQYGHLYVNLRTLLERALSTYCLLDDINAITESILQSGSEVVVQTEADGMGALPSGPTTEVNITDIVARVVDASAPYAEELYRQHQEQLLQQQQQRLTHAGEEASPLVPAEASGAGIKLPSSAGYPSLPPAPAPLPHPHPKGQQEALANSMKEGPKGKGMPYPARSASEAEASPAAIAIAEAAAATGNGPARRSRPSSAVGSSSTYTKKNSDLGSNMPIGAIQSAPVAAPTQQSRYAAYIHQTITSLGDGQQQQQQQHRETAVATVTPITYQPAPAPANPPVPSVDFEHLRRSFIHIATDVTISDDAHTFVQRMTFKDAQPLAVAFLQGTFPSWSSEQVEVAAEALWHKATSLDLSATDNNKFLTFESFVASYAVGGEVIGVTEDCRTFVIVNIGPIPSSTLSNIARAYPVPMNCMQRRAVRKSLIRVLKKVNERLAGDQNTIISRPTPYVTTEVTLADYLPVLQAELAHLAAFDYVVEPSSSLANQIVRVIEGSDSATTVMPEEHAPLYKDTTSAYPTFFNVTSAARELGIILPANLPAIVDGTGVDALELLDSSAPAAESIVTAAIIPSSTSHSATAVVTVANANNNGSVISHYQEYTTHLTPFELALIGAMFQRVAVMDVLLPEALDSLVTDIFAPPGSSLLHDEDLLLEAKDKARRVTGAITDASEKDNAGRIKIAGLAKKYEVSPSVLQLGLKTSEGGIAAAVDGLPSCGLDKADLRLIAEHLVTIDRSKDGLLELTSTHRDIRRIVQRCHPSWDTNQLDRPAYLILNTATLNLEGKITLQPIIRALAAEHYLTPEKHAKAHSGALSRRLDVADLAKIRKAIGSIPASTPLDMQWELLRVALVDTAVVGDSASLTALLETTIDHLRQQKITTERLAEKLQEDPSALSFPIMLARDCHEVCLRKLKLSVPPEVIRVVCRTLLLMDKRGDGVLRRDEVDENLKRALQLAFGSRPTSTSSPSRQIVGSPAKSIPRPGTASNTTSINVANPHNVTLNADSINELVRLIILSQFEQVNVNRFGKPLGQSATHANRNLEMNGFIDLLVGSADGSLLPRSHLPSVEVPFKMPLGYDELEILKGAIESIAADRRTSMTAVEVGHLLESAMAERRKPFVKVIGDVMLKLADGPENARFDLTEVAKHFDITQNVLTFHTSQFSPLAADRASSRVIRREKIRKLARAFVAMDLNHDDKLDKTELMPHLLADAKRTVTEVAVAKQMADSRWSEIEALSQQHSTGALPTATQTRNPVSILRAPQSDASNATRITLETFFATFCLGRFPALSELELDAIIKKASANTGGEADPNGSGFVNGGSPANRQMVALNGGSAHRLLQGSPANSPQKVNGSRRENAAGDFVNGGMAVRYDDEGANDNRSRYLSARNLSNVPIFDDELQQEFNKFDVDNNGYLNRKDFEKTYRVELEYYGVRPSVAEVDAVFRSVCGDSDKVTFEEFCLLMLKRSKM